jgi:hypothetical protein
VPDLPVLYQELDGDEWAYTVIGKGPTVVVGVPPTGSGGRDIAEEIGPLIDPEKYTMVVVQRPGPRPNSLGFTRPLANPEAIKNIPTMAKELVSLIELLQGDEKISTGPKIYLGHSIGAAIAEAAGALFPDKVDGVLSLDPPNLRFLSKLMASIGARKVDDNPIGPASNPNNPSQKISFAGTVRPIHDVELPPSIIVVKDPYNTSATGMGPLGRKQTRKLGKSLRQNAREAARRLGAVILVCKDASHLLWRDPTQTEAVLGWAKLEKDILRPASERQIPESLPPPEEQWYFSTPRTTKEGVPETKKILVGETKYIPRGHIKPEVIRKIEKIARERGLPWADRIVGAEYLRDWDIIRTLNPYYRKAKLQIGGAPELVPHLVDKLNETIAARKKGVNGLLVDPREIDSLGAKIERIGGVESWRTGSGEIFYPPLVIPSDSRPARRRRRHPPRTS